MDEILSACYNNPMEMTSTEWWTAIGQTAMVIAVSFVLLCIATSWVRFQLMSESTREAEELGAGEAKAFRMTVLNQIAAARRLRLPISVLLLRLPDRGSPIASVENTLRSLVRSDDVVLPCGEGLLGLMVQCGSEKTPTLVDRLVADATSAGVEGASDWRFGVSGYPEHGFKTSVLYPRAMDMLAQAEAQGVQVAGMADPESVAEPKPAAPETIDPLTGLIHEEKMIGVMRRYIAQERRADRPVSMVYFVIDQMDRMTDLHGATATNAMIKELAGMLSAETRESDMLARFGAGGFILSMPVPPAEAVRVAQRLIVNVRKHAFIAGNGMKVSISAGVSGYPDVIGSAVQYFVAAEAALKQAHVRGRSQCVVYDQSMSLRSENETTTQHL